MGEATSKTVALILSNQTDDPRIITLTPGTTVAQAMTQAGIRPDSTMTHPDGGQSLGMDEDLFALCEDGDKLKVTPAFTAGSWWKPSQWGRSARPATNAVQLTPVGASTPTDERWLRRYGWRRDGNAWRGYFRVGKRPPIRAYIDLTTSVPRACFENPPEAVQRHVCVHRIPNAPSWFRVNEHAALPGRTLRGFVTSVELWLQKQLQPTAWVMATAMTRQPTATVRPPMAKPHDRSDG